MVSWESGNERSKSIPKVRRYSSWLGCEVVVGNEIAWEIRVGSRSAFKSPSAVAQVDGRLCE